MAISNTKFQTSKPFFLPLIAFVTVFLMLLNKVNSADSISFNFEKFDAEQNDLILQGDATTKTNSKVLQLTKVDSRGNPVGTSVGRALYYAPVRLWESSAVRASFDTTFKFVISSPSFSTPADGFTFFIARVDSTIPPNSGGKLLGLFPDSNALKNSTSSSNNITLDLEAAQNILAVEFDTYVNGDVDPNYKHIGIDVNSIKSKTTTRWNWQNGKVATAHISYNSASKKLTVVVTYPNDKPVTLSYDIQLRDNLPEWVRVGFSASTGLYKQINNIISWSFTSSLKSNSVEKEDMYNIATE